MFLRYDNRVDELSGTPYKLDVAAPLTSFDEACRLKTALDLAKRLRPKPPQPQPR
jgi:hypothetical protein